MIRTQAYCKVSGFEAPGQTQLRREIDQEARLEETRAYMRESLSMSFPIVNSKSFFVKGGQNEVP